MNESLAANYFKSKRRDALLNKNSTANGHTNGVGGTTTNGVSSNKGNSSSSSNNNNNNNNNNNLNINNNNYLTKDTNNVSKGFHGRSNGNITLTHNNDNGTNGANVNANPTNVNQLINGSLNGNHNHHQKRNSTSPVFRRNNITNSTSPSMNNRKFNLINNKNGLNEFTNHSSIATSLTALKRTMPEDSTTTSSLMVNSTMNGHASHLNLAVTGQQQQHQQQQENSVNGITHNLNQLNNCE